MYYEMLTMSLSMRMKKYPIFLTYFLLSLLFRLPKLRAASSNTNNNEILNKKVLQIHPHPKEVKLSTAKNKPKKREGNPDQRDTWWSWILGKSVAVPLVDTTLPEEPKNTLVTKLQALSAKRKPKKRKKKPDYKDTWLLFSEGQEALEDSIKHLKDITEDGHYMTDLLRTYIESEYFQKDLNDWYHFYKQIKSNGQKALDKGIILLNLISLLIVLSIIKFFIFPFVKKVVKLLRIKTQKYEVVGSP